MLIYLLFRCSFSKCRLSFTLKCSYWFSSCYMFYQAWLHSELSFFIKIASEIPFFLHINTNWLRNILNFHKTANFLSSLLYKNYMHILCTCQCEGLQNKLETLFSFLATSNHHSRGIHHKLSYSPCLFPY